MGKKGLIFLFLIVFLAGVLRFVSLTKNPPSVNWDEISYAYNAYSILKTGADQWGQKFPILNFRAYGDYPTTLNLYLTVPFILIFGLTDFAIRFPHALLGTLTVISVYFLTLGITKKENVSLLSSFLVAIGPWYFFPSRFLIQSNLSVFFLITSAAFFVNRQKKKIFLPISFFLLSLTLFSYHTTRIFSPVFLLAITLIYRKEIKNRFIYLFISLFLIFSTYILVNPGATARGNVLFIINQSAVNKIIELRNSSSLPNIVKRVIYNRPVYFVETFAKNYVTYFSPKFLFFEGGTQYQFSLPGFGLVYPICLPFFYLGLVFVIFKSFKGKSDEEKNIFRFLLSWIILSPIPASLTNESYAVIRATTMLPTVEMLVAIGAYLVLDKISEKYRLYASIIFILSLILSAESYFYYYFSSYSKDYSWSWQYGYKQATDFIKDNYGKYNKILVTKKYGEPHEFLLYYLKYDPLKYQNDGNKITFFQSNWYWVDRFDKFYFLNDWQVKDLVTESDVNVGCKREKCLLITSPGNYPKGWHKINRIKYLDGETVFEIYEN